MAPLLITIAAAEPMPLLVIAENEHALLLDTQRGRKSVVTRVKAIGDIIHLPVEPPRKLGDSRVIIVLGFSCMMPGILEKAYKYPPRRSRCSTKIPIHDAGIGVMQRGLL